MTAKTEWYFSNYHKEIVSKHNGLNFLINAFAWMQSTLLNNKQSSSQVLDCTSPLDTYFNFRESLLEKTSKGFSIYFSKHWRELIKNIQIYLLLTKLTSVSKDIYLNSIYKMWNLLLKTFDTYISMEVIYECLNMLSLNSNYKQNIKIWIAENVSSKGSLHRLLKYIL